VYIHKNIYVSRQPVFASQISAELTCSATMPVNVFFDNVEIVFRTFVL